MSIASHNVLTRTRCRKSLINEGPERQSSHARWWTNEERPMNYRSPDEFTKISPVLTASRDEWALIVLVVRTNDDDDEAAAGEAVAVDAHLTLMQPQHNPVCFLKTLPYVENVSQNSNRISRHIMSLFEQKSARRTFGNFNFRRIRFYRSKILRKGLIYR